MTAMLPRDRDARMEAVHDLLYVLDRQVDGLARGLAPDLELMQRVVEVLSESYLHASVSTGTFADDADAGARRAGRVKAGRYEAIAVGRQLDEMIACVLDGALLPRDNLVSTARRFVVLGRSMLALESAGLKRSNAAPPLSNTTGSTPLSRRLRRLHEGLRRELAANGAMLKAGGGAGSGPCSLCGGG